MFDARLPKRSGAFICAADCSTRVFLVMTGREKAPTRKNSAVCRSDTSGVGREESLRPSLIHVFASLKGEALSASVHEEIVLSSEPRRVQGTREDVRRYIDKMALGIFPKDLLHTGRLHEMLENLTHEFNVAIPRPCERAR
jgi:hypothetical protein